MSGYSEPQCGIYPLSSPLPLYVALSLSLSRNEFISTQAQKIGDEAGAPIGIQRGEEDTIKKESVLTAGKKARLIHRSLQGDFSGIFFYSP